jgi:hypothetical protein
MCHKWRSSARTYDVNVVSDATLYVVKLARNIDCVNYYTISSSLLFSLFVFKEFNTRSVFRLHCLYNGVKVESEAYDFLATAYSMPNFRKKKVAVFWKLSCQINACFTRHRTQVPLEFHANDVSLPHGERWVPPYPSNGARFRIRKSSARVSRLAQSVPII